MGEEMSDFDKLRADYLAINRRKEKIEFLKRWGKPIPPELLVEGPKQRNPNVDPLAPPMPPRYHGAPARFLVSRSPGEFNVTPVDNDGTCIVQNHVSKPWHLYHSYGPYAEARPIELAIRCPNSLSEAEWQRVFSSYGEAREWGRNNPYVKKAEPTDKGGDDDKFGYLGEGK